jgi:hypothetical protein
MAEDFHKTERGRRYYDRDFPALITQLKRIADSLEKLTLDQEAKSLQEKKERIKKKFAEAASSKMNEKKNDKA